MQDKLQEKSLKVKLSYNIIGDLMEVEVVKMSSKGQLVVPIGFRKDLKLKKSERFAAIKVKDGVFFKKIEIPNVSKEFEELARETEKEFKNKGIGKKDVEVAVKWTRKE